VGWGLLGVNVGLLKVCVACWMQSGIMLRSHGSACVLITLTSFAFRGAQFGRDGVGSYVRRKGYLIHGLGVLTTPAVRMANDGKHELHTVPCCLYATVVLYPVGYTMFVAVFLYGKLRRFVHWLLELRLSFTGMSKLSVEQQANEKIDAI
jgi:hypothetical protein